MNINEITIIIIIIVIAFAILWYNYQVSQQYANSMEQQKLESVKITNIQGQVVDALTEPNILDKTSTDVYPDEIGFPEPAGKGVRNLTPEPSMISKYYTDSHNAVPLNNAQMPIGACPISRPMSRDLPVANAPMCMAVREDSDMRLR